MLTMKQKETEPEFIIEFTPRQERANIIIHILGIFFGVIAIPFLIDMAKDQTTSHIISLSIYAFCFLMVFASSTLYHSVRRYRLKLLFKKLDRISIYFLIAGTYTAIIRYYLFDTTGIVLLSILWTLVLAGIFFEILFPGKFNIISVIFYLIMGLIFVFVPYHFFFFYAHGCYTAYTLWCCHVLFRSYFLCVAEMGLSSCYLALFCFVRRGLPFYCHAADRSMNKKRAMIIRTFIDIH